VELGQVAKLPHARAHAGTLKTRYENRFSSARRRSRAGREA
jgi:hypothetical protein